MCTDSQQLHSDTVCCLGQMIIFEIIIMVLIRTYIEYLILRSERNPHNVTTKWQSVYNDKTDVFTHTVIVLVATAIWS